tara:strand:+ start:841 stop:1332 length:492 start_codon:yes stop_codon:yes gene_type:complete
MSRSNAAAIRRRVTNVQNNFNNPPVTPDNVISDINPPPPIPAKQNSSLNPRQLLNELDSRVNLIEESLQNTDSSNKPNIIDIIDEFNTRFEMMATEISDLKDTIIKLQSYTMDVNKMLLNERIQILSEIPVQSSDDINNLDVNTTPLTSVDMRELVNEEIGKE